MSLAFTAPHYSSEESSQGSARLWPLGICCPLQYLHSLVLPMNSAPASPIPFLSSDISCPSLEPSSTGPSAWSPHSGVSPLSPAHPLRHLIPASSGKPPLVQVRLLSAYSQILLIWYLDLSPQGEAILLEPMSGYSGVFHMITPGLGP